MASATDKESLDRHDWRKAATLSELREKGVRLLRIGGKQIALFDSGRGIRACDNRCPHEGYPLTEGSVSADCILTCNWHNWKFDLEDGRNLYGGDRLRVYPTDLRGEAIWIDLADPPFAERYAATTNNLRDAFADYDYDRVAREIARLIRLGADPLDAPRLAIGWSWQKLEFGWTHAYAGMADWLELHAEFSGDAERQLVCLVEGATHAAYDVRREQDYPYSPNWTRFDAEAFVAAVDAEDEVAAVALIRGGIRNGRRFHNFEYALSKAALLHYNDFGHALIYVTKAKQLIETLGDSVLQPLLLSLTRGLIYARREDRIPEFRGYATQLERWGRGAELTPLPELWRGKGIDDSLRTAVACSGHSPEDIYRALLIANAINILSFDAGQQDRAHVPVSGNVNWLDVTHGITFANAVRRQCSLFPDLWPRGLLQMACFHGRNARFTTADADPSPWLCGDGRRQIESLIEQVLDHGQGEPIVAVHWLKTALAVREEMPRLAPAEADILLAALSRFLASPLKRRQTRRTAYQALCFVARE
jgi:nitrite reductase/ring-hydroxylating ferredoxin subunit